MQAVAVVAAFVLMFVLAVVVLREVTTPVCPERAGLYPTWPPAGYDERCRPRIGD